MTPTARGTKPHIAHYKTFWRCRVWIEAAPGRYVWGSGGTPKEAYLAAVQALRHVLRKVFASTGRTLRLKE